MIASTAVARWTWGRDSETADLVSSCLADLAAAYSVLAEHQMARGEPVVHLSVPEWGNPQNRLFEDALRLPEGRNTSQVERLCGVVRGALRPGRVGSVDAHVYCSGTRDGEAGGPEERTFLLSASAFEGFVTVELITYSDIWMSHDLRGRAQPDVYAANAPRLSAALQGLAEALGSETDPEDPTYFGKATETGVANFFDSDGRASDVWSSFEIPYRKRRFHHTAVSDVTYKRSAEGEVQYVAVSNAHGVVLGYVWTSDAEAAASFEPRDAAGEEAFTVGHLYLDRLSAACARGLSPSQALAELTAQMRTGKPRSVDLASLRELAGEDRPG